MRKLMNRTRPAASTIESDAPPAARQRSAKRSALSGIGSPSGSFPFDEILGDLATGSTEIGAVAHRINALTVSEAGAAASGLFRAVQDTGLLVPLGRPAFARVHARSDKLIGIMARAADQSATVALPANAVHPNHTFRRRTTAPGGLVVWSTVVMSIQTRDDKGGDLDSMSGDGAGSPFHPQMMGVWVTVMDPDAAIKEETDAEAPMSAQATAAANRRINPLVQLLLQQVALRETANSARRQIEKRLREVSAIYDIGRAIDHIDIDELLDLITKKAADVMDAQACSLMLMNDATDQLVIAASYGLPDDVVENTRVLMGEGIAGRVAQTGEALLVQYDARHDPRFKGSRTVGLPGIASSIVMPMFNEHLQVRGVLCIRRRTPSPPFTEDDKRLFSIFATQAGLAIKNVRLYRELRSRVTELSTLASLTETISSTLDLDFVLNQVADSLINLVGFDRCLLYLRDDDPNLSDERFSVRVSRGFDNLVENLSITNQLIREISARLVPILKEESDRSLPLAVEYAESMGLGSFFAQPVVVRGNAIGVLVVSNDITHRPIAFSNLDLLSTFLQHAGIAIDNARLYAQMERRVRELHSLYTMSQSLTTTYGLSRACSTVTRVAKEMVQADAVLLMLFNDRLDTLRIRETLGTPDHLNDLLRLVPNSQDVASDARALREPLHHDPSSVIPFESMFGERWKEVIGALAHEYPALLVAPLVTEDTVVGFVLLGRKQDNRFRPDETKLVSIISSQAGPVLRGAALYEQSVHQRVLELSALYELSKKVRTARSLKDALDAILDIVSSVIWCDVAEIGTVDVQNHRIVRQVHRGELSDDGDVAIDSHTIPGWVIRERKALLIADITHDDRFADYVTADTPCKSLMAIPVFLGDEVLAVLQVQAAVSGLYNEDNVKMLSLIAAQAAALFRDMESLRELTSYTDNILRSIAAGVVTLNAAGRIATVNLAAERVLRIKEPDVAGQPLDVLLERLQGESGDIDDIRKMVARSVETRQIVQRHRLRLFTGHPAHAEPLIVNGSASQLLSERGDYLGVVLVFEDITKEDEMEQELARIGRLAEIGQLAAGIAHELRNPLTSIKGAAQVLRGDLSPELLDRHGEFLDIIVREADGLNSVTTEFLEFSRPTSLCMGLVSLNALIERRLSFMQSEFDQLGVTLRKELSADVPEIQADGNQLEGVFLNIILNAVQSMPDGGTFTVATSYKKHTTENRDSEGVVEILFNDTGLGIPDSRMQKIFTPFFTTKTKGTGLGLSIVQKIVDSHAGHIHVQSELGVGTAFTISLPVVSPFTQRIRLQSMPSPEIAEQRLHAALLRPVDSWLNSQNLGDGSSKQ
jgi:signal transduction histidine kinase